MISISGYTLQEKIRSNHHIDTYYALREKDRRSVLLKIPVDQQASSENLAILQHEFHLLKQIDVPTIIKAYEFIQNLQAPILILDGVEGQILTSYLNSQQLSMSDFFQMALQLVEMISELHRLKIIHKEIKPSNVMVNPKNLNLKLIDLSVSTMLSEESFDYLALNSFEEDLSYISPEQTGRMNRPVDYRTDFYSLGVTFYHMLTNQLPFQGTDLLELVHCHIAKKPPPILDKRVDVPEMLIAIIDKLLQKMPEERYSSIIGLKSDLKNCQKQWQSKGKIHRFLLGLNDTKDHLSISPNLYGRKQQVEQLIQAFNRANWGSKEIVFVKGYSGIGKTSLVKEVQKSILQHKCYYIQGKFDQLQQNIPYSAIVDAFQRLVKQVLVESEADLAELREQLILVLGNVGQVVVDVIPEVELIIGKQPSIPKLNPSDTQIRFNLAFQNFVRVFAQPTHPLVLFLDDLQWADNSSLNFIENLLQDGEIHHLLIIGSYRDNEVDEHHAVQKTIDHLNKNKIESTTVTLQPLKLENIQHLLQDTLGGSLAKIQDLALCIFNKTQGNPFFIKEFIKKLYQEKILFFSYVHASWEWDITKISQQSVTDNVIDFLTVKIHLLPQNTQEILKFAACFGHHFDFKTLSIISGQTTEQIAEALYQAILAHLISPLEEMYKTVGLVGLKTFQPPSGIQHQITSLAPFRKCENEGIYLEKNNSRFNVGALHYRFVHDRIQEASYELIAEKDRPYIHLKIGRLLLQEKPLKENDDYLFDVMKHFNQSIFLIKDINERKQLAKYNLWAGQRAKLASAYDTANEYLSSGLSLVHVNDNWGENERLVFQLYKELAVCKYLIGDFTRAKEYFTYLLEHAKDDLDVLGIYKLKVEMLAALGQHNEALEEGLGALRCFGVKIPKNPNKLNLLRAIYTIKFQIRNKQPEHMVFPCMKDLKRKAIADLMTQLFNSAFIINQKLFVLLTCISLNFSLKFGYTESTSMCVPVYAFVIMHSLGLYDEAISFLKLYYKLKQKYGVTHFEGKNHFVVGGFIEPYLLPIHVSTDTLTKGFGYCCEVGDFVYGNYINLLLVLNALSAELLNEAKKKIQSTLLFMSRVNTSDFVTIAKFWDYSIQCLENPVLIVQEQFASFEAIIINEQNYTELSFLYSALTRLHFVLGNFEDAVHCGAQYEKFSEYDKGLVSHLDGKFFYALALCYYIPQQSKAQKKIHLKKLKQLMLFVDKYTQWCSENYKPHSLLLAAEFASLNHQEALALYEQAINEALARKFILIAAIASESAARYCMAKKIDRVATFYLHNAYQYFKEWGALTKLKQLEDAYPDYINVHHEVNLPQFDVSQRKAQNMDVLAILKFTQLISSEIRLDKLLQKFMLIVLENAGAQKSIILTTINDKWIVEAEGDLEQQFVYLNSLKAVEVVSKYPISILNYVQRTKKPIIVNDAMQSELTFKDPYVQKEKPRSILIMPLFYQGQFCRILYLEHKDSSNTFTSKHIDSLQLLCSQAMTSLENAKLYYQASHDPLTGLANRNLFYEIFQQTTKQKIHSEDKIILLFLDLDYFKRINDTLGHDNGDKLLVHIADLLTGVLQEGDIAARIGGDEFAVMLAHCVSYEQITKTIKNLLHEISKPFRIDGHILQITASMGISIFPTDAQDVQSLLKLADIGLYQAKEKGRNQFYYYSPELSAEYHRVHGLDKELQRAYDNQEFFLMYQPIHEMNTGKIMGLESLLRWNHPEKGVLEATDFFDTLEKSPLMMPVSEWILRTACRQAKIWQDKNLLSGFIAVNLSAVQFIKHSLSDLVMDVLDKTQLRPSSLELEVTETVFIDYTDAVRQEIENLLKLGINLVLDDFGTGYSAFSYLKILPVNKIKIDKIFINNCTHDYLDQTIIHTIVTMAHKLNIKVVAEGVENAQQFKILQAKGVDGIQGYVYSPALTVECCETYLGL